ncbi:MAG: SIR2 family protein [Theionarchaea archaeon]|nr:SIR2 family protein [Theionarchaea archaeon]
MEIIDLKSEKGNQYIQYALSNPPVVLAGSGVSIWQPTALPTGNEFASHLYDLIFPESFFEPEMKPLVEAYFKGNKKNISGLPFEVLFEGCPSKEKVQSTFKHVFSEKQFNPVHKAIAEHFLKGGFSSVITTNYDLCLDDLFGVLNSAHDITRVITQEDIAPEKMEMIYFKIHGSADDIRGETLVFALSQESRLPEWKRALLYRIFEQHPFLLIIGYSGSDFEICPEFSSMPIEHIFWNIRGDEPSLNAKRLSQYKTIHFLKGDMRDLLTAITGNTVCAEREKSHHLNSKIEFQFTEHELMQWGAFLLYKMGFLLPALQICTHLEDHRMTAADKINVLRLKARLLFHLGKYKKAGKLYSSLAEESRGVNSILQAESLMDAGSAYRCYGNLSISSQYLTMAGEIVKTIEGKERERLLSKLHLCQAGLLLFDYQFTRIKEFFTRTRHESTEIKEKIRSNLCRTCEYAVECGSWFDFQEAALWAQKMGIAPSELTKKMDYPPPPPPREGYKHLTSHISRMIEARDTLDDKNLLSPEEERELNEYLQFCKMTGNNAEAWKLLLVKIKRCRLDRNTVCDIIDFFRFFFSCEYNLFFRILYPLSQLI